MVTVRISETYDLSTQIGKMGMVGIHTPRGSLLKFLWPGLVLNYSKFRFASCDVAMACASMLPADPLQIGVEAGSIAPQDMFNPILYKAVSNDTMSNLQLFIAGHEKQDLLGDGSVVDLNDQTLTGSDGSTQIDQFGLYYSLLANPDGWRKAMPQSGLEMRGLYPLVYQVVQTYGDNTMGMVNSKTDVGGDTDTRVVPFPDNQVGQAGFINPVTLRGPAMRMPAINTTFWAENDNQKSDLSNLFEGNFGDNTANMPPCYVGVIILPPAKLQRMYYRLKVTWTIEFTGLRAFTDLQNWTGMSYVGNASAYGTDYASQSASMTASLNMIDGKDVSMEKIMEGI